ncbi:MAG: hypothetical protein EOO33_19220 [Comamonadaceae bacterium]|nr:MAG: hypothetical protein EOO33_19220 [Comamonadaceae bacterium]
MGQAAGLGYAYDYTTGKAYDRDGKLVDQSTFDPATLPVLNNTVAIGNRSRVGANEAVAVGAEAQAMGARSIAVGYGAIADVPGATAVGTNATAASADSVALGSTSVANRTAASGSTPYVPAGASATDINATKATLAAVSVGDAATGKFRQITSVAAGSRQRCRQREPAQGRVVRGGSGCGALLQRQVQRHGGRQQLRQ